MSEIDSTGSIYVVPTNSVPNPAYPVPPGGMTPNLELAVGAAACPSPGSQSTPNLVGAAACPSPGSQSTPNLVEAAACPSLGSQSTPNLVGAAACPCPQPMNYTLVGDPYMGGYEPSNPAPAAPNLAGADGWPPAASSLVPSNTMFPGVSTLAIAPQYGKPDMNEPSLQTANLAADGISFEPRNEFDPDPLVPDLASYNRPYGLTAHNVTGDTNDLLRPDPVLADLTMPDLPDGINTVRHLLAPDPLVPDLQDPQLDQQVHMLDRPGDLDPRALGVMSVDPTAQSASLVPYAQSFVDASGMNTTRRRHFDLLMNGLLSEEQ